MCIQRAASIDLGRFVDVVPIAAHDGIAARAELARRAARHDAAVQIDDLHLDMRVDAADRGDAPLDRVVVQLWKLTGLVSVMP